MRFNLIICCSLVVLVLASRATADVCRYCATEHCPDDTENSCRNSVCDLPCQCRKCGEDNCSQYDAGPEFDDCVSEQCAYECTCHSCQEEACMYNEDGSYMTDDMDKFTECRKESCPDC